VKTVKGESYWRLLYWYISKFGWVSERLGHVKGGGRGKSRIGNDAKSQRCYTKGGTKRWFGKENVKATQRNMIALVNQKKQAGKASFLELYGWGGRSDIAGWWEREREMAKRG